MKTTTIDNRDTAHREAPSGVWGSTAESLISNVIRAAEANIKLLTSMDVMLRPDYTTGNTSLPDAVEMLGVIAQAQGMCMDDYFEKSRHGEYVRLRCTAVLLLDEYYPNLSGRQVGAMMGQHRTNVIHNRWQGKRLLMEGNEVFTQHYNRSLKAIKQWLEQ